MNGGEKWNSVHELKQIFHKTTDQHHGAGPILFTEHGEKYSDDSEGHIAVIGRTGKGKSQCCSLPFVREILTKRESLIMLDPKGETYKKTSCFIPKDYQSFCVDFRVPRKSPTKYNPLSMPYRLFCAEDPDENDEGSSLLSELWNAIYPYDGNSDKFWTDAAAAYGKGMTYGLFETMPKDMINLNNVAIMLEQSEIKIGIKSVIKTFYENLPSESLARKSLTTYVTAANETRASIRSVAASGLEVFSQSKGLMEMLSNDTLNIMDIDVTRPFVLFIVTPDETDVYDAISGILISQMTQYLIGAAQKMKNGSLPIRVNIILEELGSIGASIPSLPNLMVASRSRNMRLMLVLQSATQLVDVYGRSKAETILSCIGITILFSTNNWETLKEWSMRCGERHTDSGQSVSLITPQQLAAMPAGTALVMVDNKYKYIVQFPFYYKMYDDSDWRAPDNYSVVDRSQMKNFDFEKMVKDLKEKKAMDRFSNESEIQDEILKPCTSVDEHEKRNCVNIDDSEGVTRISQNKDEEDPIDIDALLADIDKHIAALESEQQREKSSETYHVLVRCGEYNDKAKIGKVISVTTGEVLSSAIEKLNHPPVDMTFDSEKGAIEFSKQIMDAGGVATVIPS